MAKHGSPKSSPNPVATITSGPVWREITQNQKEKPQKTGATSLPWNHNKATMTSFSVQLEDAIVLVSSKSEADKSFGYTTLLQLQQQSCNDPSSIATLAHTANTVVSFLSVDIAHEDEEIAAAALKCLGFMTYHPSIVAAISVDSVNLVLLSLATLIASTKMKSICNLAVWCISIQQMDSLLLSGHFCLLLRAVIHALENPFGSLSTTYEAMQAVMKLTSQVGEKMRESSHLWAPPIYRRLLSTDKRERDMSERCLSKTRPTILPPSLSLSKALAEDMEIKLLAGMKYLLNQGKNVQAMQAWGWFIRLLGPRALKNRHLLNDMLKIPEQTFLDKNTQVRVASQVAWEGLIEAIIHPLACVSNAGRENICQEPQILNGSNGEVPSSRLSSSIKLIMTPLVGIMSSKCDVCVHSSCLNTWYYLLGKLGTLINHPSLVKLTLDPILRAVFLVGPTSKNLWSWNLCLDLLDEYILAKCQHEYGTSSLPSSRYMIECSFKHSVKWLPWSVTQLDFFLEMINIIISHVSAGTSNLENSNAAFDAALRIFRSILKGMNIELKDTSSNCNDVMLCLNTILNFVSKVCGLDGLQLTSLCFVEAITEELESSILGSSLYNVALDLKYIKEVGLAHDSRYHIPPGISSFAYMDMVSPVVYLVALYILNLQEKEYSQKRLCSFFKCVVLRHDPLEILSATVALFYNHIRSSLLVIWIPIAEALKYYFNGVESTSPWKLESVMCHFLSYPFFVSLHPQLKMPPMDINGLLVEFDQIVEVWKSVYVSLSFSSSDSSAKHAFSEKLCSMLSECFDKSTSMFNGGPSSSNGNQYLGFIRLFGISVLCFLEHSTTSETSSDEKSKPNEDHRLAGKNNIHMRFLAKFLEFSWINRENHHLPSLVEMSRVFAALKRFVCCLKSKQRITSFIKIISGPLSKWLTPGSVQDQDGENISNQLHLLWEQILLCLQRTHPPIMFDSVSLELHTPLLEKTLDHPNSSISELTIAFWNSTYGKQFDLHYPRSLVNVLEKLSRNQKITPQKRRLPFLVKCQSSIITATNCSKSKRVKIMEETVKQPEEKCVQIQKRRELTEHQREVRRAQQGKERDCNGHGAGFRTYTSLDFSQDTELSQDSEEHLLLSS